MKGFREGFRGGLEGLGGVEFLFWMLEVVVVR
jgi:hypothetical protein